jgi:5-methylthioribose kinase
MLVDVLSGQQIWRQARQLNLFAGAEKYKLACWRDAIVEEGLGFLHVQLLRLLESE